MNVAVSSATGATADGAQGTTGTARTVAMPEYLWSGVRVPQEIRELVAQGKLSEAERAIDSKLSGKLDETTSRTLANERERLRRIRRDFSISRADLLAKIQKDLPQVTAADLDRWHSEGSTQWITIDGKEQFFRREPANIYRFSKEAKALKKKADDEKEQKKKEDLAPGKTVAQTSATTSSGGGDPAAKVAKVVIEEHVADVLAAAKQARDKLTSSGANEFLPRRFDVRHKIMVQPDAVPAGALVRCWMPFAMEYRQQSCPNLGETTPSGSLISLPGARHRTLYMERRAQAATTTTFEAHWTYRGAAYAPNIDPAKVTPTDAADPAIKEYLEARPPHLPLTPEIRALAADIVGTTETNPYRKAERIFEWMQENVRYCAEMEYGILPSVLQKIVATKRGDCGVQSLMFIALCRAAGVPARWQSGWVTRPDAWNMHDWTEFYAAPYGWIPADPSFGWREKAKDKPDVFRYYFGHLDGYRMIANSDFDREFDPPKRFMRSDPVDSQRGEVEWEGGNLYYDKWEYEVTVTSEAE